MNRKTVHSHVLAAAALLIALPVTLPAETLPAVRVQISDLDLATPLGQQRLERRVEVALDRVCPAPSSLTQRSRALQEELRQCRSTALAGLQQQLRDAGVAPGQQQVRRD